MNGSTRSTRCSLSTIVIAKIGVEPHQRVEHILRALGIELAGGFIQHQHLWPKRERRRDGHTLAFTAAQRFKRARAQRGQAGQIERLFHAHAHLGARQPGIFKREGDLILDLVEHKLRLRVLKDKADVPAHLLRTGDDGIQPGHPQQARTLSAGEMRHQPIERAQ